MLYQVEDVQQAIAQAGARDPGIQLMLRGHLWRKPEVERFNCWVDDRSQPRVFVFRHLFHIIVVAAPEDYAPLLDDLLHQRLEQNPLWPEAEVRAEWDQHEQQPGRPRLVVHATAVSFSEAAISAGFIPSEEDRHQPHYFYWATGEPRFSEHVKHACRVCQGRELWELLRGGIQYDETGEYVGKCLDAGPSFVCEIDGENGAKIPVCFSCMHLSGSMGAIFTPEEHRGHGYGRSLAAFQIDYVLNMQGAAWCHVNAQNIPSYKNLDVIGVPRLPEPMLWRMLYWPE